MEENERDEILRLASYLWGYGNAVKDDNIKSSASYMRKLSEATCAGGIIGCRGGKDCTSDHK